MPLYTNISCVREKIVIYQFSRCSVQHVKNHMVSKNFFGTKIWSKKVRNFFQVWCIWVYCYWLQLYMVNFNFFDQWQLCNQCNMSSINHRSRLTKLRKLKVLAPAQNTSPKSKPSAKTFKQTRFTHRPCNTFMSQSCLWLMISIHSVWPHSGGWTVCKGYLKRGKYLKYRLCSMSSLVDILYVYMLCVCSHGFHSTGLSQEVPYRYR